MASSWLATKRTEPSDLLVPYGILSRDGAIDVEALALQDGRVATFTDMGAAGPLLRLPSTTVAFDASHLEGADVSPFRPKLQAPPC